jgi:hypothetical protein
MKGLVDGINLEAVYNLFKEEIKNFELFPVEKDRRIKVEPHQLRLLSCNIPNYWLLVDGVECEVSGFGLYRVVVLTEDLCLADFREDVPYLRVGRRLYVACLPFWIYLTNDFIEKYSVFVAKVEEVVVKYLLEWVKRVELPDVNDVRGRYIVDMMELTSWWNMNSILDVVDVCEEYCVENSGN